MTNSELVFVTLSQSEFQRAKKLGIDRNNAKPISIRSNDSGYHSENIPNRMGMDSSDRAYPHVIGAIGEIAFGMLMKWRVNFVLQRGGDDMDFPGVEVKTVSYPRHRLIVKKWQYYSKAKPKYYVANRIDVMNPWLVEHCGMISREDFDALKEEDDKTVFVGFEHLKALDQAVLRAARDKAVLEAEQDRKIFLAQRATPSSMQLIRGILAKREFLS